MNLSSLPREALLPELLNLLKNGLPAERVDCARLLGRWKHQDAKTILYDFLGDAEEEVCVAAAEAIGACAGPSVIPLLGAMAREHPDGEARMAAVGALARIDVEEAHAELLALVNLPEASEGLEEGWNPAWDVQRKAISLLDAPLAEKAVPVLMDLLMVQETDDLEPELLAALARAGSPAEDAFRQLLSHPSSRLRRRTARAIRHWRCKFAPVILFRLLQDQQPRVRIEAISSLAYRTETAYIRDILLCLEDPSPDVRSAAIDAIQSIMDKLDKPVLDQLGAERLKQLFTDDDPRIRQLGWQLIANQHHSVDENMAQWLEHHSENLHPDEICSALDAIPKLKLNETRHRRIFEKLWVSWDREDPELGAALAKQWPGLQLEQADNEKFGDLLATKPACIRFAAVNSLVMCTTGPQKDLAFNWLQDILRGESQLLTNPSAELKQQSGDPQRIPVRNIDTEEAGEDTLTIQEIMDRAYPEYEEAHPEPVMQVNDTPISTLDAVARNNVRQALATAAGEADQDGQLDNMLNELPEEMWSYAQVVREHVEAGDKLSLNGRKKADFPDSPNATLVIRALGTSESNLAVKWLREHLLASDTTMQAEAANSLRRIAERRPDLAELSSCLGPLGTLLSAGTPSVRTACASALGALGHPNAMPLLLAALEDMHTPVRLAAMAAIASCLPEKQASFKQRHDVVTEPTENQQILAKLNRALGDPEPEVRAAALRILAKAQGESIRKLLLDTALNDPDLTEQASQLLAILDPETTVKELTPTLKDSDQASRAVALRLLLAIPPKPYEETL
tara:strand:+ start:384 stop:2774 length:2391 start_codon:yes stop_codon:yes gene_type:complete